jgi:hypothetical protein
MGLVRSILSAIIFGMGISLFATLPSHAKTSTSEKKIELYVYINADNDIIGIDEEDQAFHYGTRFFESLNALLPTLPPHVGIHVYYDPSREITGATSSQLIRKCGSQVVSITRLGETASSDPKYLSDLTNENCFSENIQDTQKILILWGHGQSWMPITAFDYSEPSVAQSWLGLIQPLKTKFDLLIYDSCMMGSLEVAIASVGKAKNIIASQFELPPEGIDYRSLKTLISENPTIDDWIKTLKADTEIRLKSRGFFAPLIGLNTDFILNTDSKLDRLIHETNALVAAILTDEKLKSKLVQLSSILPDRDQRDLRAMIQVAKNQTNEKTLQLGLELEKTLLTLLDQNSGSLSFTLPGRPDVMNDFEREPYFQVQTESYAKMLYTFSWIYKNFQSSSALNLLTNQSIGGINEHR